MADGTSLLTDTAAKIVDLIVTKAPKVALAEYKKAELLINKGLPEYLRANYGKCETIRTLLRRDSPTKVDACFVAPDFKCDEIEHSSEELLDKAVADQSNIIITGLAGSGKSVFQKHAFRRTIERGDTYYPVFFELRDINTNENKERNLEQALFASIEKFCEGFTVNQFRFCLRRGAFYLLLDGFDEVPFSRRDEIAESIIELTRKYPQCPLILTSRPSESFISWEGFTEFHLLPFSKEKAIEYVEKIEFPKERSDEFITALKDGLYEKHSSFLSNPLLCAMMLLTYDEYGDIPAKRHIFFEKCFQVLLREHDVSKGRYRREFLSQLEYDDMEEMFKYFCAFSYLERDFQFNAELMASYVKAASKATGIDADVDGVITDFTDSISIIQKDGDYYEFAHRSFQEYFFAKFVVSDRQIPLQDKMSKIKDFGMFDDTTYMIADMNRAYFETDFVLPELQRLLAELDQVDPLVRPSTVLSKFFDILFIQREKPRSSDGSEPQEPSVGLSISIDKLVGKRAKNLVIWRQVRLFEVIGANTLKIPASLAKDLSVSALLKRETVPIHHSNDKILIALGYDTIAASILESMKEAEQKLSDRSAERSESIMSILTKDA